MTMLATIPSNMLPVLDRLAPSLKWKPSEDFVGFFVGKGHGMSVTIGRADGFLLLIVLAGSAELGSFYDANDAMVLQLYTQIQAWCLGAG